MVEDIVRNPSLCTIIVLHRITLTCLMSNVLGTQNFSIPLPSIL